MPASGFLVQVGAITAVAPRPIDKKVREKLVDKGKCGDNLDHESLPSTANESDFFHYLTQL